MLPQHQNGELWISCLEASGSHFAWQKSRHLFKQKVERDTVASCYSTWVRSRRPCGLSIFIQTSGSELGVLVSPRGHVVMSGDIWGRDMEELATGI